jgi:hypothetical protein
MTKEDIIRMAREAGLASIYSACDEPGVRCAYEDWDEELERFFTLAYEAGAAAEREACADICDQHASIEGIAQRCAAEIRARNKT